MTDYPEHLAHADRLLAPDELREKYYNPHDRSGGDGEHPKYPWWDWYQQVAQRRTREGYWTWVAAQLEDET